MHSVFLEQLRQYGRCVITAEMFRHGYLLSIDQVSFVSDEALVRVSLSFPITDEDLEAGMKYREYTDSRGTTHRVNSGGYRCTLRLTPDFPGYAILRGRFENGYEGNVGVRGPERLFLVPQGENSGVVFLPVERLNPVTGETVIGLTDVALIAMSVGPLAAVDNRDATPEDVELLRAASAAPAAPATPAPAAPATPARPAPAGQAAPRSRFAR